MWIDILRFTSYIQRYVVCGFMMIYVASVSIMFSHHLLKWNPSSGDGVWRFLGSFGVFAESRVFLRSGCLEIIAMWWKKSKIQSGYFLWVHLGVGVYIEMVRYGGWKNPGFMIFHEVSSMIKGDDPGKTPALDDESWVVYRVGLPIWMLFFFAHDFWIQKTGQVHFWNLQKDRHLQEIYGNMGTNKWTGIKLGVASQLESG